MGSSSESAARVGQPVRTTHSAVRRRMSGSFQIDTTANPMAKLAAQGGNGFTWVAMEPLPGWGNGKWDLVGENMHILSVGLGPGETTQMEPGSMMFMGADVEASVNCDGCLARCVGGEACAAMIYENKGAAPTYVGMTPPVPADVVALDMAQYDKISARSGAYMASVGAAQPSFELDCCTPTCCCAGFGCVRQTISADGQGGTAFINATGTVERKTLEPGETLVIDSNSLVAWHGAALGVRPAGSCMACCCNGEGCCNTTVTGPGTAWVQSMPWAQYKAKMGVTIKLDKAGNVVAAGAPPSAELHRE